jgi:hypothetical protein
MKLRLALETYSSRVKVVIARPEPRVEMASSQNQCIDRSYRMNRKSTFFPCYSPFGQEKLYAVNLEGDIEFSLLSPIFRKQHQRI